MAASKSVEEICQAVEHYRLISSKDLAALRARWFRPGRKEVDNADDFRRWLVVNRYLTEFVAKVVSGRKSDQLVLNEYRLQDQLVSGPMAGAYLAIDPLDRHVAIEVLSAKSMSDKAVLDGFQRAALKVMKVRHPNVGATLDVGEAYGLYYLVKEYYEGKTLEEILSRRGKLPYLQAARLFALALAGVGALHKEGIGAGDLTADCLLLAPAGKDGANQRTVKILHAGIKRQLFDETAIGRSITFISGIPDELELATSTTFHPGQGVACVPADDIFRLGCLFYQCITGRAPYSEKELSRPTHKAQPIAELAPDTPEMLCEIVEQMIDPEPANRQANADHVAKSLRVFLAAEEHTREAREEEKIVEPRAAAKEHVEERHAVEEEAEEEAEEEEPRPRRARRKDGSKEVGLESKLAAAWAELQPNNRELLFLAGGALGLLAVLSFLHLVTGINITFFTGLLTGAAISFFVDRYLKWREQRGERHETAKAS